MKKILILTVISAFLISCQQETIPTYSGTDQIYFSSYAESVITDNQIIRFGYDDVVKQDSTLSIGITVQGSIKDYDRPVNFIVIDTLSNAKLNEDFELPGTPFIPAGEKQGELFIKLKNTKRLDDTTFIVSLRLVENEHFKADYHLTGNRAVNNDILAGKLYMNSTEFYVVFDNNSEMPNWFAHPTYRSAFNSVFGTYSKVKFALMCQILPGCSREYFTYTGSTPTAADFNAKFPMGLLAAWAMRLNSYLVEYKATHDGQPLLDENGVEVKSGTMFV